MAYEQFTERRLRREESKLRKLAVLFGGMSNRRLACTFVNGLPEQEKQLFRAPSWMDVLAIDQLLAQVRAIMKDEVIEGGPGVAIALMILNGARKVPTRRPRDTIICRRCNGANHFVKDSVGPHVERRKP